MFGQQNHQGHMAQHPPMGQQLAAPVGFQTQMAPTTMYPGALMQPATSDVQSTLVLSEARQHHSDLRQAVIQVSDKINNISQKVTERGVHVRLIVILTDSPYISVKRSI